jgi:hypothetical protein
VLSWIDHTNKEKTEADVSTSLKASIERLGDARSLLVEKAIARVARAVAEGPENFKVCSSTR